MKKILSLLLILIFCFAFVSCNENDEKEKRAEDGYTVIYDFEKGIYSVRMNPDFGKVVLNKDAKYAISGNKSIKLMPVAKSDTPFVYFPFSSVYMEQNYAEIDRIESFKLNVYSEADTKIGVGCYFSIDASSKSLPQEVSVSKGWNEVEFLNELSLYSLQFDTTDFIGIYLCYMDNKSIPELYVDDVRALFVEDKVGFVDLVQLKSDGNYFELCDFEYAYQNYIFNSISDNIPEFEIVKASSVGLTAPSGDYIFKIIPTPVEDWSHTRINFSNAFFKRIDWAFFREDTEKYEFKFDLYQVGQGTPYVSVDLSYNTLSDTTDEVCRSTVMNEWTTVSCNLSMFNNFLTDPVKFSFHFDNSADTTRIIYIDNVRIERIQEA